MPLQLPKLMEGSTVHVLRGARPHTLVSTSEYMCAARCDQQTVSHMRMCCALLLGAGQLLQDARAAAGLTEKQLMEGSTVHVLRGARPPYACLHF